MDWPGIQVAIADLERRRLGLPTRLEEAAKRAEMERANAVATSGLETAEVNRAHTEAQTAALPAEQDLRRRSAEALITDRLREPQPRAEPADAWSVTPDGKHRINRLTGEVAALGVPGGVGREPREDRVLVQVPTGEMDPYGNPIYEFVPREDAAGRRFGKPDPVEQRNRRALSAAGEVMSQNLQSIRNRLAEVKQYSGAGAITSPVDAYNARESYRATVQNLAVAANRVLGDTSGRYSDVDRQVAANMLGITNDILLIADPALAEKRLADAEEAMTRLHESQVKARPTMPTNQLRLQGEGVTDPTSVTPARSKYKIVKID